MTQVEAKLSVVQTPAEELVAKAAASVTVTDAKGRVFVLGKPGVLAQYRIVEILGESASNQVYMGMVLPLLFVRSIDGEPTLQFKAKAEVEALIQQLDDDGIKAVMEGVQEHFGAPDPEADKAALKKP